jgi:hypothetical protein
MGGVVNATLRPLYPRERNPPLTVQDNLWVEGPVWMSAANLAPNGILSRDSAARSDLLYRLSYRSLQKLI